MMRIAICDDEAPARAYLASLIRAQNCPCEIVEHACADDCLAEAREIDLLFLDIELDPSGPDGMELARQIRARPAAVQPTVVFVTGHERYVFDAFDVGAFQYLLKPVDEGRFAQVFARAVEQIGEGRQQPGPAPALTLRCAGVSRTVPLDRVRYIESSGHKVVLRLGDGDLSCYAKIRDLEAELGGRFCRIHKGYLVNLAHVQGIQDGCAVVRGDKLLISRGRRAPFLDALADYVGGISG